MSDSQLLPTDAAACKSVPPTPVEEEGVMCITEGFSCFSVLLRKLLQLLFDPDQLTLSLVRITQLYHTPKMYPQTNTLQLILAILHIFSRFFFYEAKTI